MDEFGKALMELVKSGAPLAGEAIRWYYISWIVTDFFVLLGWGGLLSFAVWLAKLINNFGERRAKEELELRKQGRY